MYEVRQEAVDQWNEKVAVPGFFEGLFASSSSLEKRDIPRPLPYDGISFENTIPSGGYGQPSYGLYDIYTGEESGYKPFGAMGQGMDNDLSVKLGDAEGDHVMLVQILPHLADWDQSTHTSPIEVISLEIGSYPWVDSEVFATPVRPGT